MFENIPGVEPQLNDIVAEMRGFADDHEPDGWPAVRMRQITALCDEVERLRHAILTAAMRLEKSGDEYGVGYELRVALPPKRKFQR